MSRSLATLGLHPLPAVERRAGAQTGVTTGDRGLRRERTYRLDLEHPQTGLSGLTVQQASQPMWQGTSSPPTASKTCLIR